MVCKTKVRERGENNSLELFRSQGELFFSYHFFKPLFWVFQSEPKCRFLFVCFLGEHRY